MNELWNKAYQLKSLHNHKLWLVWTIGHYANGCPWVELRCIYTNNKIAKRIAKTIEDYEIPKQPKNGPKIERVYVEERVSNHPYGADMMELRVHLRQF